MAVSQAELAEKGALIHLQDLRAQMDELYKTYPGLLKAEQNAKRNATMLAKYGTLNPHKAAEGATTKTAKVAGTGPKKSHKKGAGKKAQEAAQAAQTNGTGTGTATEPGIPEVQSSEGILEAQQAHGTEVLEMTGAESPEQVG
jgi:hypothetical protein